MENVQVKQGLAITSMVFGILAIVLCPTIIFGPLALILGVVALVKASRRPEEYGGKGFAITGMVTGGVAMLLLPIMMAIAIPNLLNAINRGRQKRTMADMRTISTAWDAYQLDNGSYCPPGRDFSHFSWGNISSDELNKMLTASCGRDMPIHDGWGNPLQFGVECQEKEVQRFGIRSGGKDAQWEMDQYPEKSQTYRFDCDIVNENGTFIRSPEGIQNN